MIRVKNSWEAPSVPKWFREELKSINRNFRPLWERISGKWLIVSPAPVSVFRKGYVVEYLVERDGCFYPLNHLVLETIRWLLWEKENTREGYSFSEHLKELEEDKLRKQGEARKYRLDAERGFNKAVNRHKTHTVI